MIINLWLIIIQERKEKKNIRLLIMNVDFKLLYITDEKKNKELASILMKYIQYSE